MDVFTTEKTGPTRLLTIEEVRKEYRLGRDTAYSLAKYVPHVRVGRRYLFRQADVEDFLKRAASERWNLRTVLKARAKKNRKAAKEVALL